VSVAPESSGATDVNHPIIRPERRLLACVCTLASLVLLTGAARPAGATAANVPNPDPPLIARWEPCEPNTGVTVIVDDQKIGDMMIDVGCALGEQATGVEALQHAGFALEGTTSEGLAFICRIDGEPTPEEEGCETTPGGEAYWSYWRGKPGGRWAYSGFGAKSPQSRSPINSVEGWSFGGGSAPRIEPMDGSGPSSFRLPPEQQSSVAPAELAREWLAPVLDATAEQAEAQEAKAEAEGKAIPAGPEAQELLPGAIALVRAGTEPAALRPLATWLARSCKQGHATVEGCPLRGLANPGARREEQLAQHFALAVLGLQALGENPESFAGMDPRGELEGMIKKSTGQVTSEGQLTGAVEVTAPTVLALARTGTLPEQALKTVELILAAQDATGGFEESATAVDVEAVQALAAAREQGAGVLGDSRLEAIDEALGKAGGYLEGIQEAPGGVPAGTGSKPNVESTALAAVGLALTGHQAAGERAAKWVSSYQVTAEYAGVGNPETGEHTPAEDVIGAFLPNEAALRNALAFGVASSSVHGLYSEARPPTADALLALVTAGPYGTGTGVPTHEPTGPPQKESSAQTTTGGAASQGVLASLTASPARVQTPVLDGLGAGRGLVGVSWRVLEPGVGLRSWTIASQTLGAKDAHYVTVATGNATITSALLKLPPGFAYELQITFTDALGRTSSTQIGKVIVPHDDRWSGLRYAGRWRRLEQPGAWLGTITRAAAGAEVSATLPPGRPVLVLRAAAQAAQVEVRAGAHHEELAIARGSSDALREITATARSRAGTVSLRVLKGTVNLDGVAVEG
jgi:hypothetical protein